MKLPRRLRMMPLATMAVMMAVTCGRGNAQVDTPASSKPYRVAVIMDGSGGALASIGKDTAYGIQAYIGDVNKRGGINGRKIELGTIRDGQSDPTASAAVVRQLINEKPDLILLYVLTSSFSTVQPVLAQARIPTIALAVSSQPDVLPPSPLPWLYQVNGAPAVIGEAMVNKLKDELGTLNGKKVVLLGFDTPFVRLLNDAMADLIKAGGGSVASNRITAVSQTDFTNEAQAAVREKADGVIFYLAGGANVQVPQALTTAGFTGPIISGPIGGSINFVQQVNNPQYFGLRWASLQANDVISKAGVAAGMPALAASRDPAFGWAMGAAAFTALSGCGKDACTAAAIINALDTKPVDPAGVYFGPIVWSSKNHAGSRTVGFANFKEGALTVSGKPFVVTGGK